MDANRFDRLAKGVAVRGSRRAALTGFFALGGLLGANRPERAETKTKCKKPCGACRRCKQKKCRPKANGTPCSGGTCQSGQCVANAPVCNPPCTGGRVCDSATQQCACPPDRPHSGGFCDDTCRACCIDDHCGRFNGKRCDHTQGSICVCANSFNHDCGLLCTTCCIQEHCIPIIGDQSRCVEGGCRCNPGLTPCFDPVSGQDKCTDTRTDEANCGECGRDCPAGTECRDSNCA